MFFGRVVEVIFQTKDDEIIFSLKGVRQQLKSFFYPLASDLNQQVPILKLITEI